MNWFRIEKEKSVKPISGTYKDWKDELANEGNHQCVYCTIKTRAFGGIRNFHVEHYKPKSVNRFPELTNDYNNLFFACSICNGFKSDDWPNEPNNLYDLNFYPDPSVIDYSILFNINNSSLELESNYVTGKYIIQKLYLNREQLIMERKEQYLNSKKLDILENISSVVVKLKNKHLKRIILTLIHSLIIELKSNLVNPYTLNQIKR